MSINRSRRDSMGVPFNRKEKCAPGSFYCIKFGHKYFKGIGNKRIHNEDVCSFEVIKNTSPKRIKTTVLGPQMIFCHRIVEAKKFKTQIQALAFINRIKKIYRGSSLVPNLIFVDEERNTKFCYRSG